MSGVVLKMAELDLANQRVLVREDLNVPVARGRVGSDARIRAALPTLDALRSQRAAVMVMSHLGRPTEGEIDSQLSLAPVAERLSEFLETPVRLETNWLDGVEVSPGEIVLCENVRFLTGEKGNDVALAKRMAALCDIFVMDAFGTAHRAHASTHGVARFAPLACAGPLLAGELEALEKALNAPARPVVAIVGGAKVSTKLGVLESLTGIVDQLVVGGGIANTFIAAAGHAVGKSLQEANLLAEAARLTAAAVDRGAAIPIARDVVVGKEFSAETEARTCAVEDVHADEMILDIGPQTAAELASLLSSAGTIVWNGPVGVFEFDAFAGGTRVIAEAIAASPAFSIAGGGDTLAAVEKFGVGDRISYISTGGGAFLEFLEGKILPAVAVLEERAAAA